MTDAEFRALVERLEPLAAEHPGRYRARLGALALVGYAYIGAMLALLLLLFGLAVLIGINGAAWVGIKLVPVLLIAVYAVLRALWVRFAAPGGIRLRPRQAPAFFEEIEELRTALRAPRVHVVKVDAAFNAAIVQVPRLGMLGWYRNHLLVGLPLLQAVTPGEWRGVLAHELAHLSGRHGRFASWIYRQRSTWSRLLETLEEKESSLGLLFFGRFFRWFSPFFNAYSFVLARAHEYEADRAAAAVAGAGTMRDALIRIEATGQDLQKRFWAGVQRSMAETPEPPEDVHQRLRAALRSGPDASDARAWLAEALRRPTDATDTHPGLGDRLRALGWQPSPGDGEIPALPRPFDGPSAAEARLGEVEVDLERALEQGWVAGIREYWRHRFDSMGAARSRLAELEEHPPDGLGGQERWEMAALAAELGDEERAEVLAYGVLETSPDHAAALLFLGQRLLHAGSEEGTELVERAMSRSPDAVLPGCETLFHYHWSRGEREAAERYRLRHDDRAAELRAAELERATAGRSMELVPHDVPEDLVRHLTLQLAEVPWLGRAWLARRVVQARPEVPCYVMGLEPKGRWWLPISEKRDLRRFHETVAALEAPGNVYFFLIAHDMRFVGKLLRRVPGAELDLEAPAATPGPETPAPEPVGVG